MIFVYFICVALSAHKTKTLKLYSTCSCSKYFSNQPFKGKDYIKWGTYLKYKVWQVLTNVYTLEPTSLIKLYPFPSFQKQRPVSSTVVLKGRRLKEAHDLCCLIFPHPLAAAWWQPSWHLPLSLLLGPCKSQVLWIPQGVLSCSSSMALSVSKGKGLADADRGPKMAYRV